MVEDGPMQAVILEAPGVTTCGVCHTDLHVTKEKSLPEAGCPGPRDLGTGRVSAITEGHST